MAAFDVNLVNFLVPVQDAGSIVTQSNVQKHNPALHLQQHSPPHHENLAVSSDTIANPSDSTEETSQSLQGETAKMAESAPTTNGAPSSSTESPAPDSTSIEQKTQSTPDQSNDSTTKQGKKPAKQQKPQQQSQAKQSNTEQDVAEAGAGVKLTGKQLKEQKKAEKAARRAEQAVAKGEAVQTEQAQLAVPSRPEINQRRSSQSAPSGQRDGAQQGQHHRRRGSNVPSGPGGVVVAGQTPTAPSQTTPKYHEKKVPLVSHLYPSARPASLTTATREIHPSVLTLALHLRSLTLVGSTARTLSLLLTLKRVIHAYTTPPNTALSRHLTTHISHQISFLSSARTLGIAQGNAIRWLKKLISTLDPDLDENEAKKFLCASVDSFIREKVTLASEVIATQTCARIEETGETILVYGKSSVVEKTLLKAAREENKKFKVIVVDSRPLFEGRNLVRSLLRAGMCEGGELEGCQVVYSLISGLTDTLEQNSVTKCFLGASGMLGNGGLYSRCGSAMVAMMAKAYKIPVLVLAETVKFTAKMAVDSLSLNEVGDADALVERREKQTLTSDSVPAKQDDNKGKKGGGGGKKKAANDDDKEQDTDAAENSVLSSWRDQPNLYLLNLMYDVTPKEYLDMVICELGTLPPGAVPVVNGVHGEDE